MIPARHATIYYAVIGPVLDASGAAVIDCVVADFKIKKTSGSFAALNASSTLAHVGAGMYDLVLAVADISTVGQAVVAINDGPNGCNPLYLQIIEQVVFDAIYGPGAGSTDKILPAILANGVTHGGATATLQLKTFVMANPDGPGLSIQGSTFPIFFSNQESEDMFAFSGQTLEAYLSVVELSHFGIFFSANTGNKTVDSLSTPKNINISVDD